MKMKKDRVIETPEGFYARVNGVLYGPWIIRGYAVAGLQTEQRRAAKRLAR